MAISTSISRFAAYYGRHGFAATLRRFGLAARRAVFSGRTVLFYFDLSVQGSLTEDLPSSLKVERYRNQADLRPHDLQEITGFWNPKLATRNIEHRFEQGASLWLIKSEGQLAGYGWTLQGRTVEPHYFPLGLDDVHLFNFHVFPQHRGRNVNPSLVTYILSSLAAECQGRAFIEAAEWNHAQLASLRRTPFRRLGSARKFTLFRHAMVFWDDTAIAEQAQTNELNGPSRAATGPSNSGLQDLRD
ncbi:MAG: GNAT family N-acetyltransferase [Candidatus Sulfotelmatobacter sp.]